MDGGLITAVEITLLPFDFTIGLNATLYLVGFYSIIKDCRIFKSEYFVKTLIFLKYLFLYLIYFLEWSIYFIGLRKIMVFVYTCSICRIYLKLALFVELIQILILDCLIVFKTYTEFKILHTFVSLQLHQGMHTIIT